MKKVFCIVILQVTPKWDVLLFSSEETPWCQPRVRCHGQTLYYQPTMQGAEGNQRCFDRGKWYFLPLGVPFSTEGLCSLQTSESYQRRNSTKRRNKQTGGNLGWWINLLKALLTVVFKIGGKDGPQINPQRTGRRFNMYKSFTSGQTFQVRNERQQFIGLGTNAFKLLIAKLETIPLLDFGQHWQGW